jgi:hypothetical protein
MSFKFALSQCLHFNQYVHTNTIFKFQAYKSDWNMEWHMWSEFSKELVTLVANNKTTFPVLSLLEIVNIYYLENFWRQNPDSTWVSQYNEDA